MLFICKCCAVYAFGMCTMHGNARQSNCQFPTFPYAFIPVPNTNSQLTLGLLFSAVFFLFWFLYRMLWQLLFFVTAYYYYLRNTFSPHFSLFHWTQTPTINPELWCKTHSYQCIPLSEQRVGDGLKLNNTTDLASHGQTSA